MTLFSLSTNHLAAIRSAEDIYEIFRLLGYQVQPNIYAYSGAELDVFEFDEVDAQAVQQVYVVGKKDQHTVYLLEVDDLRHTRLRGLAWNALQRGTALLALTRDYREIVFVDPRFAGKAAKGNVRVNKLKVMVSDPTRHDVDTLNAIHAHDRSGDKVYAAQGEVFNVTTITNRFYREYKRHYDLTREAVRQYNKAVPEFQNADQEHKLHAYTQRLLGRIMFLYFLQRKGWLGGQARFLTDQFIRMARTQGDYGREDKETFHYYQDVLAPLFFETMNRKRLENATRWPGIQIPYLNGGLFDPSRDPSDLIILPDSLFDPNSSEGLLAFFNRYNFTIAEDTPLEQDVAVDPEMLGKVFENMLEERDRGQSGSFYTPRTIVSYMCQEALAGYLEESTEIARETIRHQFNPDNDQPLTSDEAQKVKAALATVTVLDPAVGSGSFLLGMLHEIITLERSCAVALGIEVTPAMVADWKERIIRETLYGVDIKPEAIEIAQLRLWLSLVVDQTLEQAHPLPNLDYKLMAGNSLIETIDGEPVLGTSAAAMLAGNFDKVGVPLIPVQHGFDFFPTQQVLAEAQDKISDLRRQFFTATPDNRADLRRKITSQEREIVNASLEEKADKLQKIIDGYTKRQADHATHGATLPQRDLKKLNEAVDKLLLIGKMQQDLSNPEKALPFFLYHLHFSEIFQQKGGFDIVVANPPYVRMELFKDDKPELKLAYPDVYSGRADLYVYFYVRAYELLRDKGQLAFISSNKWLVSGYGQNLRRFLRSKTQLDTVIDLGDLPIFDAIAYPCIVVASKKDFSDKVKLLHLKEPALLDDLTRTVEVRAALLPQSRLTDLEWQIAGEKAFDLVAKLKSSGIPLGELVKNKIFMGVKTGLTEAFVIDRATQDKFISDDPNSSEVIKPFLLGRDIKRWCIEDKERYLLFIKRDTNIDKYPAIKAHLEQYKSKLEARATSATHAWYELQQPQMGIYHYFEEPKIFYQEIATFQSFTMIKEPFYANNKCFFIASGDYYLLGILNSLVTWFFLGQIASKLQGGAYSMSSIYVSQIPIPDAPPDLREKIANLAQQCLDHVGDEVKITQLEAELNQLVYQAYGLTTDEIAIIEEAVGAGGGTVEDVVEGEE